MAKYHSGNGEIEWTAGDGGTEWDGIFSFINLWIVDLFFSNKLFHVCMRVAVQNPIYIVHIIKMSKSSRSKTIDYLST